VGGCVCCNAAGTAPAAPTPKADTPMAAPKADAPNAAVPKAAAPAAPAAKAAAAAPGETLPLMLGYREKRGAGGLGYRFTVYADPATRPKAKAAAPAAPSLGVA
jgi:hypothetical protein